MELIIVRHGRPERVEGIDGGADPALNEIGHEQAEKVGAWLAEEHIDAIYVSPMLRARHTAAPLERIVRMDAVVVEGIKEFDAEEASYIPMDEMKEDKEAWRAWLLEHGDKNRAEFNATVRESIEKIVADHRGHRVAIVCHGGTINAWAAGVLGLGDKMFFAPDYTSINRFMAASSGERSVLSLNETGHLRDHDHLRLL